MNKYFRDDENVLELDRDGECTVGRLIFIYYFLTLIQIHLIKNSHLSSFQHCIHLLRKPLRSFVYLLSQVLLHSFKYICIPSTGQ